MAFDSRYIAAFNIEDVLLDKDTGAPLSGGIVTFEKANQPGILKDVFQITYTSGIYNYAPLPNPMTLSSIGTFVDALDNPVIPYFYPYDASGNIEYYRVVVESSGLVPQFVRDPVPNVPSGGDSIITSALENELSNPQFAEVLFNTPTTLSFNTVTDSVVNIAPGWDLVVSSPAVGSVTLSIKTPTGSLNRLTNPGTLLNINSASLSKLQLRQRLYGSPNLWGSGYLAGTFVAKTYVGTSSTLSLLYSQSDGVVVNQVIATGTLTADGLYHAFPGSVLIPPSDSTEFFPDAYVDIFFNIPLSTEIDITSIMVAFTNDVSIADIIYAQTSEDRQIDHLFHYYNDKLQYKPIPSYTIGWDFPFNPAQELGGTIAAAALGANKSRYIADQTIAFEAVSNVLSYTISSPAGLSIFTTGTTPFAIIQYLDTATARELLAQRMSVCLRGITSVGTLVGNVSLYFTTDGSLPNVATGTNNSLVATMTAGKPATFNGNWAEVSRGGLGNATFTLTNTYQNFQLSEFDAILGGGFSTATFFAIVVSFNAMPSTQTISIQFCTLNAGDIASPPPALSAQENRSALEAYYETSYQSGTIPASVTEQGQVVVPMSYISAVPPGMTSLYAVPFSLIFRTVKRTTPNFNLYSPNTGSGDTVRGHIYTNAVARNDFEISLSGNWTKFGGNKGFFCIPSAATTLGTVATASSINPNTTITWQYVADCRFGIV